MLVLARKVNDIIKLGRDIRIKIISVRGENVRIGIEAPQEVAITREDASLRSPVLRVDSSRNA